MKVLGGLIVVLAVCAISEARVPKDKRALETSDAPQPALSTTKKSRICSPQTPCAWKIYGTNTNQETTTVPNSYCVCGAGTSCVITEDDPNGSVYIMRCRPPHATDILEES